MTGARAEQLYADDFYAWTQLQAKELRRLARSRPNVPIDLPHVAEEIADLGKSQRDSLRSWARRILEHLLLLEHSPANEPRRGSTNSNDPWTRSSSTFPLFGGLYGPSG